MDESTDVRPRIFLSYASQDRELARKIADHLKNYDFYVWYDLWELKPGDSITQKIEEAISTSNYLIILLSPSSIRSEWVRRELIMAQSELTARDVTIIPILISDVNENEIPIELRSIQWLDLRKDPEKKIGVVTKQITNSSRIDFSHFDGRKFERLTSDLLKKLGFTNIQYETQVRGLRADIIAEYQQKDPFGVETREVWIVEIKFYKSEKADLRSLYQLMQYVVELPERYKVLLITNSQLTSTAKEWLKNAQDLQRFRIRVIEGPELKNLLIRYPELVQEYFPAVTGEQYR